MLKTSMAVIYSAKINHGCRHKDDVVKSEWMKSLEYHCCGDRTKSPLASTHATPSVQDELITSTWKVGLYGL